MMGTLAEYKEYTSTQASTASYATIGTPIFCRAVSTIALTIKNSTNAISFKVEAANCTDFSDAVEAQAPTDIAAGAVGYYAALSLFSYYRVRIIDKVGGSHGTATLSVIIKS